MSHTNFSNAPLLHSDKESCVEDDDQDSLEDLCVRLDRAFSTVINALFFVFTALHWIAVACIYF